MKIKKIMNELFNLKEDDVDEKEKPINKYNDAINITNLFQSLIDFVLNS
jgi:hypothetical protein